MRSGADPRGLVHVAASSYASYCDDGHDTSEDAVTDSGHGTPVVADDEP
jgi:hypothetical protein